MVWQDMKWHERHAERWRVDQKNMLSFNQSQDKNYWERSRTIWAPSTRPGMSAITRAAPPSARVPPTSHTPSSSRKGKEEGGEEEEMWKEEVKGEKKEKCETRHLINKIG